MSRISKVAPRYKAAGLTPGAASPTTRHVNGQLTPELIDALVRFKDLLVVDDVMEEHPTKMWVSLEVPLALEDSFLQALGD